MAMVTRPDSSAPPVMARVRKRTLCSRTRRAPGGGARHLERGDAVRGHVGEEAVAGRAPREARAEHGAVWEDELAEKDEVVDVRAVGGVHRAAADGARGGV